MSIKYNEFGEVISVNGLTTGQRLGAPMQDYIGTEEENSAYGTELSVVTRVENVVEDEQPKPQGGDDGRGLKILEATTIEELYNKFIALDNPVAFKLITDGTFSYETASSSGEIGIEDGDIVLYTNNMTLVLSEYGVIKGGGFGIGYDGETLGGEQYNFMDNSWEEFTTLDFSNITKFTVYYF